MTGLVVRRIAWTLLVVWFVLTATFAMIVALPADPARTLAGAHATEETLVKVRAHCCLDRSVVVQYRCYVGRIARGDLGTSFRTGRAVRSILGARVWPTIQLALAALLLQLAVGVPLGVVAAARRGRWPDRAAGVVALLGQSAPVFLTGTLLLFVFAYYLGWFPLGGYGTGLFGRLYHLVLPAASLAAAGVAYYARLVRTEMIDVLALDHVRTARAKGLSERAVVVRHGLRVVLGPLVTLAGLDLGVLLGGAVVTEYIFAWPGIGRETLQAVLDLDIPLVLGVVLVAAIAIAVANLIADLLNLWLDPRLRD